jgi:plasmid maintenance system killer protein
MHTRDLRLRELLTVLNSAGGLPEMNRHSSSVHGWSGDRSGLYAMTVQAKWGLTLRFFGEKEGIFNYLY